MIQRRKLVSLIKYLILLHCIYPVKLQEEENEKLLAELRLDDLELIDMCEDLAFARKYAFLNSDYHKKIEQEQRYGVILKSHYDVLREFTEVPTELERNWTYQVKPGNALLPEAKWDMLVLYQNHIEELTSQSKLFCHNRTEYCVLGISDYQAMLNNEKNFDTLKNTWQTWQNVYNDSDVKEFKSQLGLLREAALLNEFETVQEYWEALSNFPGAYEQADIFWEEIFPFYKKLHNFVKTRLFKYHKLEKYNEKIPAFLLGGELGTDWSNIAHIILPHPQLHFDVESYLQYKDLESVYEYSENIATAMGFGPLGDKFWKNSDFNYSVCGHQLFEYCDQGYTELIDCNKISWPIYLKSQESAIKIALNNLDYTSLPRQQLRYCALDDAVIKLGSLLATESLEYHGILEENVNRVEGTPEHMTRLLLTALKVMPRLAYSLMADKWRMEVIKQNYSNIAEHWWKYRKEYTGVSGILNRENEYLEDLRIISNKPYISDFFGTLIAFQLLSFYKERSGGNQHIVKDFGQDDSLITMIKNRHSTDWPYLLTIHYGLDLSAAEILKYFEPLENYFETAPLEQVAVATPTTTTTTSTTSTTEMPSITKSKTSLDSTLVNDEPKVNYSINLSVVDEKTSTLADSHIAMYTGVGILIVVGCFLTVAFVFKNLRRKRRTNNRRFDT